MPNITQQDTTKVKPEDVHEDDVEGRLLLATQDMKFSDVLEEMAQEDGLHHSLVYLIRENAALSDENALADWASALRQAAQNIDEALDEDVIFVKSLIDEGKA